MSRYQTMLELKKRVDELSSLCGLEASKITVRSLNPLKRAAEALGPDRTLCSYLDAMNFQLKKLAKAMDDIKVDLWSVEQDEQRMSALERELAAYKKRCQELQRAQEENQGRMAKGQKDTSLQKYGQLDEKNLVQTVIKMRDRLLMSCDWLKEQDPDNVHAVKLVHMQLQETRKMLEGAGVEVLDQGGRFDCTFQTIMDTRPAPTPQQKDNVAATVRPGYRIGGEMLRAQEVIVYV